MKKNILPCQETRKSLSCFSPLPGLSRTLFNIEISDNEKKSIFTGLSSNILVYISLLESSLNIFFQVLQEFLARTQEIFPFASKRSQIKNSHGMKSEKNDDLNMKQPQIDDDHVMKSKAGQIYYDVYKYHIQNL